MSYLTEQDFIVLLEQQQFSLIKSFNINNKINCGDLLKGYFDSEILSLLENKEVISSIFNLSKLLLNYTYFCGGINVKPRFGYEVCDESVGIKFIPKGILTFKLKNKTEEFSKNYNCVSYVCDEYIYLGIKKGKSSVNAKKEKSILKESKSQSKTKK